MTTVDYSFTMSHYYESFACLWPWALAYCLTLSALHVVAGSIFFDLVHWLAHQSGRSSNPILRCLARIHIAHHQYFDRRLNFDRSFSSRNLLLNLPLELLCQVIGSVVSWHFSRALVTRPSLLGSQDLHLVLAFLAIRSCVVAWNEGRDWNHVPYAQLPKDPYSVFVGPQYHALHHIDPQGYYGSMVRLVDWLFGTASTLRGRSITITGARGALGQALLNELSQEKGTSIKTLQFGRDWDDNNYDGLEATLRTTDILILAHGSKGDDALRANCESAVRITNTFMRVRKSPASLLKPEIWYIGSEAELHGAWTEDMVQYTQSKRVFAQYARAYYDDEVFVYRHIVPAAFSSRMGPALVSARWVASVTLWWVRRGARYVPVTYTGLALVNFVRFYFWVKPLTSGKPI